MAVHDDEAKPLQVLQEKALALFGIPGGQLLGLLPDTAQQYMVIRAPCSRLQAMWLRCCIRILWAKGMSLRPIMPPVWRRFFLGLLMAALHTAVTGTLAGTVMGGSTAAAARGMVIFHSTRPPYSIGSMPDTFQASSSSA